MLKRIIPIILVFCLISTVFYGCKNENNNNSNDTQNESADQQNNLNNSNNNENKNNSENKNDSGNENSSANENNQEVKEKQDPITFTMFYGMNTGNMIQEPENTQIGKWVKEKTGVTIEPEYIAGDLNTKIGVMVASEDYPDLIWGHISHPMFVEAGACVPLDEYIEEYGVNTKKYYDGLFSRMKSDDGNIYYLSPYRESINFSTPTMGFYIQRAVLKEFGWPEIKTLDEYLDLIRAYIEKYPQIEGNDTIGYSVVTEGWRFFTLTNPAMYLSGHDNNGVYTDPETYECTLPVIEPEHERWYKALNEMYNEGLLDKESFVMTYDQYIEKLSSGRVLGMHDYQWQMGPAQSALEQQEMFDRMYVCLPIVFEEDITDRYLDPPIFGNRDGISISINCKDPVRAFKFLDFIQGEEAQQLINWGIEGETYTVGDDGKYFRTEAQRAILNDLEYQNELGLSFFNYPWPTNSRLEKYSDGNPWVPAASLDEVYASYDEHDKEVLDAYDIKSYIDLFAKPVANPWGFAWSIPIPPDHPAQIANTRVQELGVQYLPKLIMSSPDEFDEIWNEYVKEIKKIDISVYENFFQEKILEMMKELEE